MSLTVLSLALLFIGAFFWAISWRITGRLWFSKTDRNYTDSPLPPDLFRRLFADMSRIHGVIYILLGIAVLLAPRIFAAYG